MTLEVDSITLLVAVIVIEVVFIAGYLVGLNQQD